MYGVGVNDADYAVYKYKNGKRTWMCPYYKTWVNMLKRCSEKWQERNQTYKGCSASTEWLTFSNFRNWMEKQEWEDLQLDKDLLVEGNKIYSADTCVFVTPMVNSFTLDCRAARGEWLIGVCWNKEKEKFQANCRNPFTGKNENLGRFTCELQAHKAWKARKHELACQLADIQADQRVAEALRIRYK